MCVCVCACFSATRHSLQFGQSSEMNVNKKRMEQTNERTKIVHLSSFKLISLVFLFAFSLSFYLLRLAQFIALSLSLSLYAICKQQRNKMRIL